MKNLYYRFVTLVSVFVNLVGFGSDTNTPSLWSGGASTILMSKYYGTIFGGTFYPGPMSFSDIYVSRQNNLGSFTADLSIGQKLDRINQFNKDGGNEYDLILDQTAKFGSDKYPVLAKVGITYLAVYKLGVLNDDFVSQNVRLDFPIRADLPNGPLFQPYVEFYHYNLVGGGFENKGWIGYIGLIRDQPIGCELLGNRLKINIDYRMGINTGVLGSNSGIEYHRLGFGLPLNFGKWLVQPSVIFQIPGGSDMTYVHENDVFGTLFIRRTF